MNTLVQLSVRFSLILVVLFLGSCATVKIDSDKPSDPRLVAADDHYTVLIAQPEDTFYSLAERYLGHQSRYWMIADFNQLDEVKAGQEIVIPHYPQNPAGVYPTGYQTVPILVYHRFGRKASKLTLTPDMFESQMAYLKLQGYRVIRLSDMYNFLQGQAPLPKKAVAITIDDGFKSSYTIAYPILKKYGFPATLFVYSDFVGLPGGLSWPQMREMVNSDLIDIQSHSKTHANLALRQAGETLSAYKRRIRREIQYTTRKIKRHLKIRTHTFSYPYGDTNDVVVEQVKKHAFRMATTVQRGGNASFADPFRLRRTLIYGDEPLEDFKKALRVFSFNKHRKVNRDANQSILSTMPLTCADCTHSHDDLIHYHKKVATMLAKHGDLAPALIQWKIIRALESENLDTQEQIDEAEEKIQKAVESHLQRGKHDLQRLHYKQAQHAFLAALALDPFKKEPHRYLQQIERSRMRRSLRKKINQYMPPQGKM